MAIEYHVSPTGSDAAAGDALHPFATIGHAARIAEPGDIVTVHEGVYREWVDPRHGGRSENERIVYRGAPGEAKPVIKGSERVQGWRELPGHPQVWTVTLDNAMFGDFNPFAEPIFGDWLESPKPHRDPAKHVGDVYLNEVSMFEVSNVEETFDPQPRTLDHDYVTGAACPVGDVARTRLVWHARADAYAGTTIITANFQGSDPNEALTEVSVRRACFFPSREHIDYITVHGFEMMQATGDWAPPTAKQWGMVGPNWAYGWVIEDCDLHDAKFSAVSLGACAAIDDNAWMRGNRKTGHQYQLEAVFTGLGIGWKRGVVGGHIVRNNDIHDCGQNAIVGHMGGAFSRIEHNRIRRIALKREFFGWEVAGIKLHAAIDTVIARNDIADCSLGMWLDWQAQGTRVTGNVFHRNVRDLMVEVTHGPLLVDDNILASPIAMQDFSQGGAFVHNLICGSIERFTVLDRATPYHRPHATDVAGVAVVSGGDVRYLNNLFAPQLRQAAAEVASGVASVAPVGGYGLAGLDGYPLNIDDYHARQQAMWNDPTQTGNERNPLQPAYAGGNVYTGGCRGVNVGTAAVGRPDCAGAAWDEAPVAGPSADESSAPLVAADDPRRAHADPPFFGGTDAVGLAVGSPMPVWLSDDADGVYLECDVPDGVADALMPVVDSAMLGVPRIVEERFERPDGTGYVLDADLLDVRAGRDGDVGVRQAGPLSGLVKGRNRIRVWAR